MHASLCVRKTVTSIMLELLLMLLLLLLQVMHRVVTLMPKITVKRENSGKVIAMC